MKFSEWIGEKRSEVLAQNTRIDPKRSLLQNLIFTCQLRQMKYQLWKRIKSGAVPPFREETVFRAPFVGVKHGVLLTARP